MASARTSKALLRNGGLAFLGIVLAFLVIELAARVFGIRGDASFFTRDPVLGWALRPGAEGWNVSEGEAYVRINQEGRRDEHESLPKPSNVFRVAVLGDSMVEARQVDMQETFTSLLDDQLVSCVSPKKTAVETFNFGVGGYGTSQELLMLRTRVWTTDPDLVVLAAYLGNDLHDNHPKLNYNNAAITPFFVYEGDELVLDES